MSKLIGKIKKRFPSAEQGQILIVVAFAIVGIIAIMGLVLDVGILFVENARLRRAVDLATLAAAFQYRANYDMGDLDKSAIEFLRLNGINDPNAVVQVCLIPAPDPGDPNYIHHNPDLCSDPSDPPRKLVRVYAQGTARLAFLSVIGITKVPIAAEATSEAASVDVVLLIDRSDLMTWTANVGDENRDPSVCNASTSGNGYVGDCHPFDEVKRAAAYFVDQLYFPYDRISIVTFDKEARTILNFTNDPAVIIETIKNLTVFQGEETVADPSGAQAIYPNGLPSRWYDETGTYFGMQCPQEDAAIHAVNPGAYPDYPNPAPCTTTNIGGGLFAAGNELASGRQQSLWVVILLTDGVANAGYGEDYYCPGPEAARNTWNNTLVPPKCNDGIVGTRHTLGYEEYDAEDFAYDGADFVALPPPIGQNALIFTIGLGPIVKTASTEAEANGSYLFLGEKFLQYAANQGKGAYSYAPNSTGLREVFRAIAENIATRLAH